MAAPFIIFILPFLLLAAFALIGAAVVPSTVRGGCAYTRMAAGFAAFPILCVAPLYFSDSFIPTLTLTSLLIAAGLWKTRLRMPSSTPNVLFWIAVAANLLLLAWGTWSHTGLGDHDPYEHAMGVSYIFETGSIFPKGNDWMDFATLDPYPPGYDACAAALARLTGSVAFGLRLWAILCAAMFPMAVRFFARASGLSERSSAVAGMVALFLPSAPTHFAWTHTMGISLTLVAAGSVWLLPHSRRWAPAGGMALAALALSASSDIFHSLFFLIPATTAVVREKRFARAIAAVAIALLLCGYWGLHAYERISSMGTETLRSATPKHFSTTRTHFDPPQEAQEPWYKKHHGNARPYEAAEFLVPNWKNYFNAPVGLPAAAFIPGVAGLILLFYRRRAVWPLAVFALLMVAVQGERLPAEFFPHRIWSYLAVMVAIGCAAFLRYGNFRPGRAVAVIMALLVFLSLGHSVAVRVRMESLQWINEIFTTQDQRDGYYRISETLRGEKIFPFAGGIRFGHVPAMGGRVTFWGESERAAAGLLEQRKFGEAIDTLKKAGYHYLILDSTINLRLGANTMAELYRTMAARPDYRVLSAGDDFTLFGEKK